MAPARSISVLALDAVGNPVRREILQLLGHQRMTVGELASRFPVSRPAVSKHLRILREAELVDFDREGRRNVFKLRRQGFAAARDWLDAFWDEALTRFKIVAENTAEIVQGHDE